MRSCVNLFNLFTVCLPVEDKLASGQPNAIFKHENWGRVGSCYMTHFSGRYPETGHHPELEKLSEYNIVDANLMSWDFFSVSIIEFRCINKMKIRNGCYFHNRFRKHSGLYIKATSKARYKTSISHPNTNLPPATSINLFYLYLSMQKQGCCLCYKINLCLKMSNTNIKLVKIFTAPLEGFCTHSVAVLGICNMDSHLLHTVSAYQDLWWHMGQFTLLDWEPWG